MTERLIKIFGERNTGTNLLRQILSRNSSVVLWPGTVQELGEQYEMAVNTRAAAAGFRSRDDMLFREGIRDEILDRNFDLCLGWKHGAPAAGRILSNAKYQDTLFLVISKNPYAWLLSTYRRPYHNLLAENTLSFQDFLRKPWLTVRRDNAPGFFETPIEMWNYKYRAYMEFARTVSVRFLKYEDILENPDVVLSTCDVPIEPGQTLDIPEQSLKGDAQTFGSYRELYRGKFWSTSIEIDDIKMINQALDHNVLEYSNYVAEPA